MSKLAFQAFLDDLSKPTRVVGMFPAVRRDSTDQAWLGAARLCRTLDGAGIRFAAIDEDPLIKVHIAERDFSRLKESGIKLPGASIARLESLDVKFLDDAPTTSRERGF